MPGKPGRPKKKPTFNFHSLKESCLKLKLSKPKLSERNDVRTERSQPQPSAKQPKISIDDSEPNDSNEKELTKSSSSSLQDVDEAGTKKASDNKAVDGSASKANLPADQSIPEDQVSHELKKLCLDQNGTFMADFNPEKSRREMRKINRKLYTNDCQRTQLYNETGLLIENSWDLCDCLDKDCPGCHFPCSKCSSCKCGLDCRCNRKYIIELIEVEGAEALYAFPE